MNFPSPGRALQQSGSAGAQDNSSVSPLADAAAFGQQLREIANAGSGVPEQTSAQLVGASRSVAMPLTDTDQQEYSRLSHGGSSRAMLLPSVQQSSQGQAVWAFAGRSRQPLYSEDVPLVEGLRAALIKRGFKERTAKGHVGSLLRFGRWLVKHSKQGIAQRLHESTLNSDAAAFEEIGGRGILTALGHLRTSQMAGGGGVIPSRTGPFAQDAELIKEYKSTVINEAKKEAATAYKYGTALGKFSEYLRNNAKLAIAARLHDKSLDEDLMRYEATPDHHPKVRAALAHLRKTLAGDDAVELDGGFRPDTEASVGTDEMRSADVVAPDSVWQRTVGWPEMLPAQGHERDAPSSVMDQPSPSVYLARQAGQIGRSADLLYSEDIPLILGLREALLRGGAAERTASSNVDYLLGFDRWLFGNDRQPIAERLDHERLDEEIEEFIAKGGATNVRTALAHLRTSQAAGGVAPVAGQPDLKAYPDDAALIKQYKEDAAAAGTSKLARTYASVMTNFSHYLRENNRQSIAARLEDWLDKDKSLIEDMDLYKQSGGSNAIRAALKHVRTGGRKPVSLHAEDAPLISGLENALIKANFEKITAQTNVRILRRFSRWLVANEKLAIAVRLYDKSLDKDAAAFDKSGKRRALTALGHLRASAAGIAPRKHGAELSPYPEDADLIEHYKTAESWPTARNDAPFLISFSDYSRHKQSIAARISDESLDGHLQTYNGSGGHAKTGAALARLAKSAAGVRTTELRRTTDEVAPDNAPLGAVNSPVDVAAEEHDHLSGGPPAASTSSLLAPIPHPHEAPDPGERLDALSENYENAIAAEGLINALDWDDLLSTEYVVGDDEHVVAGARSTKRQRIDSDPQNGAFERQSSHNSGSEAEALAQLPANQPDASVSQEQNGHGYEPPPRAAPGHVVDEASQQRSPQRLVSWPLLLPTAYDQDHLWGMLVDLPAWSGLASPERAPEIDQVARPAIAGPTSSWSLPMSPDFDWSMLPATPASVETRSSDVERGVEALMDLLSQELRDDGQFRPSRTPTDAGIQGVAPAVKVDGHNGQRLGLTEWLHDEHIAADYALVEEELYWNNPDLARQTRFVHPAKPSYCVWCQVRATACRSCCRSSMRNIQMSPTTCSSP
ncbi:hypothetical protein J2R76_003602 [Bradyrhizobium sp. USDA 4532]|uniref:hypothetical protein n=1 Tax=unclassified Bradyrhizobium TaxID=2631580 RepID=UPI00209E8790|nr:MULTISPECIES: hypothetical protein [unclassified Bradyrhizobium]MCP1835265.1 hypothetical protein [Bradyrhizobium sp. USDA 4545]MCP1920011.1 hypothetical protein [Bradyrhizobium sp. USDA 4532]